MRLLHTETYELYEFEHSHTPPYAILSHRWQDEEITYQKFQDSEFWRNGGVNTTGWAKIKGFCDVARSHDLQWGWVDTCCIDKSSSAELSEAINSMFLWYAGARKCIVYLVDVLGSDNFDSFERSKWFTRGWTLQELIAPRLDLVFYDSSWMFIGTRMSLCDKVSMITGIPAPILFDPFKFHLGAASIAQRMSWAAERRTSRPEDQAYCLMGIFDINMPLLYGEGRKAAFQRLQYEIIRMNDDESIFAWKGDLDQGSMFASSPYSFIKSATVLDKRGSRKTLRPPYSISNKGLNIQMEMYPYNSDYQEQINSVDGMRSYLADRLPSSQVWIAPINCSDNERHFAVVLRSQSELNKPHSRIGHAQYTGDLSDGETRGIFVMLSDEVLSWYETSGEHTITGVEDLELALCRDLIRYPNIHRMNPYGFSISKFHLELSEEEEPVVLFVIPDETNVRTAFAPLLEQLGLPPERVEHYRKQWPNFRRVTSSILPYIGR